MPWNNTGGSNSGGSPWGNPRPGGPWGQPPQGGGGGRGPGGGGNGPDLDDAIRQAQAALRRILPGGGGRGGNGKWIGLGVLALIAVWAASGIYRVQPDEQGVVMRFGAFNRTTQPGLNYRIPWPVESVTTPRVTRINRIDIGFRSPNDTPLSRPVSARDVLEESMMLTGDENIIDIDFAVFWRIRDAGEYLFNTRNPDQTVKSAAESVMREVVGRTPIQPALTEARAQIEQAVRQGAQFILDQYGSGIEITQIQLLKVDPPPAVIDAFRDVQRANADRERARNEAEAYRNDIIPRARGEGQRMIQEAEGFKESQVARARGEAARFLSVLTAYQTSQDVTVRRLYLETMEEILRKNPKIVVDDRLQGVVPYLPLDGQGAAPQRAPQAPAQGAAQSTPPAPPAVLNRQGGAAR
ncbi:FtsH protease activity modulator HflK [Pseudoroseomonas ludipueritiae]|uniref:Protein HflK n=1 Tax=Pseudoroseomonas ludipueritiae TaxID=198093 RepID=A0ABR7RE94_9PROT|nr:FtsH protease activity modulator HflK [Pseudoroseomonas ludipueritiae]MBC9179984.1 FtsH protease activity modulator HflK [Pseudoroseomonas ludipueritiae]MCG7363223.1 FtsH protease activity modulator HflK [Roseomonas sp. ACRSG]